MGFIVKDNGGGSDFELPPEGMYLARCLRIVDLGTQKSVSQGKEIEQPKLLISWELLGDARTEKGEPFMVSQRYTASLNPKSNLSRDLESWRGRDFTDEERAGFDIAKLLGKPCTLNITHTTKNGKTYTNIKSVNPVMAGVVPPAMEGKPFFFTLDPESFDQQTYESLSEGLRNLIAKSPEYQQLAAPRKQAAAPAKAAGKAPVDDDDIPF